MPLTNVQIQPGFNKQITEAGAEGQWVDGDFCKIQIWDFLKKLEVGNNF